MSPAWDFQQRCLCDQQSLRSACAYAQSDQSLCLLLEYSKTVQLLTEHHLEFLSLKGDCTGSSESTLVKMPHCCKSDDFNFEIVYFPYLDLDVHSSPSYGVYILQLFTFARVCSKFQDLS